MERFAHRATEGLCGFTSDDLRRSRPREVLSCCDWTFRWLGQDVHGPYGRRCLPYWASQLASLRYEVIASHEDRIPGLREWIVEVDVPSRRLSTLVREAAFPRVDLLAIDVEGYDFEVVKQIDQLEQLPRMIYYEHRHLSESDYQQSLAFLRDRGYRTASIEGDTFAERA